MAVDVNGENSPKYLTINRDMLNMHNISKDSLALEFASSSKISISVFDVYYIDKFGIKKSISSNGINAKTDGGVSGNITVNSPVPTNNTIRYFGLAIVNEEGLKDTVRVQQYPLIYITNQQGWYSYRDDFRANNGAVTTYEQKGNSRYVSIGLDGNSWNGKYEYGTLGGGNGYFWHSKYVSSYNNETGKSNTNFYKWEQNSNSVTNAGSCETGTNARMYHVRVTATSDKYKVGRPRITDGYTDSGDDNAELVSPSFMIASRLGAIYTSWGGLDDVTDFTRYTVDNKTKEITGTIRDNNNNGISDRYEIMRDHCEKYVEVYVDDDGKTVVLDDWRVPTRAEIDIIIDLQGGENTNADAIDYLLNGSYYMSASGPVYNNQNNNSNANQSAIRCVRDAYDK